MATSTPESCHANLRAPRYARSVTDIVVHPELFRCQVCNMILSGPDWAWSADEQDAEDLAAVEADGYPELLKVYSERYGQRV